MRLTRRTHRATQSITERLSAYGYPSHFHALAPCGRGVAEYLRERLTRTPSGGGLSERLRATPRERLRRMEAGTYNPGGVRQWDGD